MNIFFLDKNPIFSARSQCDKHVVKMILETTQMLSTAARRHDFDIGYKTAYPNHPMTLWVGDSWHNFKWSLLHPISLGTDYNRRYEKIHACCRILRELTVVARTTRGISFKHTPPPLCMPDEFKNDNYVQAFKKYYKNKIYAWKTAPRWYGITIEEPFYTGHFKTSPDKKNYV